MSAPLPNPATLAMDGHDQFVVSHGKGGALGVFTALAPLGLGRGQQVVVRTSRGVEIGEILRPATHRQALLLGAAPAGQLLRAITNDDATRRVELAALSQRVYTTARALVERDGLALELLDVETLFDGAVAIVQFVGVEADAETLAQALEGQVGLAIRLENLAIPSHPEPEVPHACDKPDCGRTAGGGCTTCSTGGGCSTCGSSKVDLRDYFGHLRAKMEENQRVPLA